MTTLETWQRFLEILENIPEEEFDMSVWWCGTAGCLAGHAAKVEPQFELALEVIENSNPIQHCIRHTVTRRWSIEAIQDVFHGEVPELDIAYVFSPESYIGSGDVYLPMPPPTITKSRVANRIKDEIELCNDNS